ncbi:MAG TPA: PD-(D/E)XK nuclease family protein [Bacilli bacterium]|nr:PD-(D/E)XK nuclease family protein [Bacilli bacterium]
MKSITKEINSSYFIETEYHLGKKGRVDIAVLEKSNNKPILFIENKLEASLTDNQPVNYVKYLLKRGGKTLVFFCPDVRKNELFLEVKNRLRMNFETKVQNNEIVVHDKDKKCLVKVYSWVELISMLEKSEENIASLKGYDDFEAIVRFFEKEIIWKQYTYEEYTIDNENVQEFFALFIFKLRDRIIAEFEKVKPGCTSIKGLNQSKAISHYVYGYLSIDNLGMGLIFDATLWAENGTPFFIDPYNIVYENGKREFKHLTKKEIELFEKKLEVKLIKRSSKKRQRYLSYCHKKRIWKPL